MIVALLMRKNDNIINDENADPNVEDRYEKQLNESAFIMVIIPRTYASHAFCFICKAKSGKSVDFYISICYKNQFSRHSSILSSIASSIRNIRHRRQCRNCTRDDKKAVN